MIDPSSTLANCTTISLRPKVSRLVRIRQSDGVPCRNPPTARYLEAFPDLSGRPRAKARTPATARVEVQAGVQDGTQRSPSRAITPTWCSEVSPRVNHVLLAAITELGSLLRASLGSHTARQTHVVDLVGVRAIPAHAARLREYRRTARTPAACLTLLCTRALREVPSRPWLAGGQGEVSDAGRVQDVDPLRMVEIGVVWSGRAEVIENAQEGVHHHLDEVGFSLINEKVGDQCSCAVLVDEGVVDEPVHGSSEIRQSLLRGRSVSLCP